ncbi:MAG TPA: hydrogenase maturation protease [Spirochaetota bacterium]|nr:hydrogenase maturation protease [Spirochaetota bacterium]HNT10987.1 hydrogenase maturation protease [Spirochaetota bacterium]HOS38357.1 hydrogenase maturation protease [Spirochaetota bacterium]
MELSHTLHAILADTTCIVGIGNYLRSDDAVGLEIVDELKDCARSERVSVINAEDVMESFLGDIRGTGARNVIIIDAVSSVSEPGNVVFGRLDDFDELIGGYSTHKLALKLACQTLADAGQRVYLLGIGIMTNEIGVGLSANVRRTADTLAGILAHIIKSSHKEYVYVQ